MFSVLARFEFKDIQRAVQLHLNGSEGKFFPTPSHIINILEGEPEDRSEVAWREFRRAVEKYGPYESVRFPKPAFHYAIKMLGGWLRVNQNIGEMTEKDIEFFGKDFKRLYTVGEQQATWANVPSYFPGEFERHNCGVDAFNEFVPDVYLVDSGKKIKRNELQSGTRKLPKVVLQIVKNTAVNE